MQTGCAPHAAVSVLVFGWRLLLLADRLGLEKGWSRAVPESCETIDRTYTCMCVASRAVQRLRFELNPITSVCGASTFQATATAHTAVHKCVDMLVMLMREKQQEHDLRLAHGNQQSKQHPNPEQTSLLSSQFVRKQRTTLHTPCPSGHAKQHTASSHASPAVGMRAAAVASYCTAATALWDLAPSSSGHPPTKSPPPVMIHTHAAHTVLHP